MLNITSISKAKNRYYKKTYDIADLTGFSVPENPFIDLIEAVVSPDSWNEGGTVHSDENGKLVIYQKQDVHDEIAELFQKLREMNALQIGYIVETAPFDSSGVVKWNRHEGFMSFNGQSVKPELKNGDQKVLVRVQADSASPVAPELTALNEPFYFVVPAGKQLELSGTVSTDRQQVRMTATLEGNEPQTRTFHAKAFGTTKR